MTKFEQWQADPDRVAKLRNVLELPIVREAMELMTVEGADYILGDDSTPHGAHIMYGKLRGFRAWPAIFQTLAQHPVEHKPVPQTYGVGEE